MRDALAERHQLPRDPCRRDGLRVGLRLLLGLEVRVVARAAAHAVPPDDHHVVRLVRRAHHPQQEAVLCTDLHQRVRRVHRLA
eukprot:4385512-Prymnesium_polylepis.1